MCRGKSLEDLSVVLQLSPPRLAVSRSLDDVSPRQGYQRQIDPEPIPDRIELIAKLLFLTSARQDNSEIEVTLRRIFPTSDAAVEPSRSNLTVRLEHIVQRCLQCFPTRTFLLKCRLEGGKQGLSLDGLVEPASRRTERPHSALGKKALEHEIDRLACEPGLPGDLHGAQRTTAREQDSQDANISAVAQEC